MAKHSPHRQPIDRLAKLARFTEQGHRLYKWIVFLWKFSSRRKLCIKGHTGPLSVWFWLIDLKSRHIALSCHPPLAWVTWAIFNRLGNAEFKPMSLASDRKVCRAWRPLIRSRCKCVLDKDQKWKAKLFRAVFVRRSIGPFPWSPQLCSWNLVYTEKTVYCTTHKTGSPWTTQERSNTHFM